ncbi:MAG: transposase, partial [Bifidobacterium sp.]|nr:transposase [Bifidobacterium sp.]
RIRTSSMIERLNREIRGRTRVAGSFPDGRSALMPVSARIRHVTANDWSTRRYLDMSRLHDTMNEANRTSCPRRAESEVRKPPGTT